MSSVKRFWCFKGLESPAKWFPGFSDIWREWFSKYASEVSLEAYLYKK